MGQIGRTSRGERRVVQQQLRVGWVVRVRWVVKIGWVLKLEGPGEEKDVLRSRVGGQIADSVGKGRTKEVCVKEKEKTKS